MADLLVTGTDTAIGKTVVAAGLIFASRANGRRAVGFKPAETGIEADTPSDSQVLAAAAGVDEPLAVPLLRLEEALAPAVASERAGTALDPAAVLDRIARLRAAGYDVIVEGAGGLLVPLAWGFSVLDLAMQAALPTIVVARAGLGTLNHTCLTAEALMQRDVTVRGVVLNGRGQPSSAAEETNVAALTRLLPRMPIIVLPRVDEPGALAVARRFSTQLAALLP